MRLEIHSADGGEDALIFAGELAKAIATYSGTDYFADGKVLVFDRL